ncbi:hypothetical protein HG537_0C01350 [Torulaspora globosa]|uniref:RGS domain-containing protein n=1 Tax=Torulaspora globosa TaxID=48254 RepID=A0A7H9HNY8_9SACH|nr:hypothetical protein HG537_0C01350 [Torulaspora sp. CBS 2947]
MEIDYDKTQQERLPTLYEVLIQTTYPPVDSWEFYTYLSQFPYAIDYLDFWIDLMAHVRLCKDYVKCVRDSVESNDLFTERPRSGDNESVTSSLLLDALLNEGYLDFQNTKRVGKFLQGDTSDSSRLSQLVRDWKRQSGVQDEPKYNLTAMVDEMLRKETRRANQPRITRKQLVANAQQICNTYLLSAGGNNKYLINVPDQIKQRILQQVQHDERHDPEVFDQLKSVAYQFLETDCFPKFLSTVALHNIHDQVSNWRHHPTALRKRRSRSPFSNHTVLSRVLVGLLWLVIGFWIGYTLIFLHYSRAIRTVTLVPFTLGCYSIVCGLYRVDIIYACFGLTQMLMYQDSTPPHGPYYKPVPKIFKLLGGNSRLIAIQHPFIKKLLWKRGLWCALLVTLSTAIFTVIFTCVPSYRL